MAAYAAFKHVELYNVGKTKKRVLRPPGGGTSDIFGGDMPQTPRSIKNHMQSNIFSCDKKDGVKNNGDQPRRGQKNVDSYQRLFGEPDRAATPAKNHMKSNIPFGSNNDNVISNGNGNGHHYNGKSGSASSASSSVSSSTENLKMNGYSKTDGNPVTGEGYNKSNDFSTHTPSVNGANQVINKNRIPPGGFSSGLW
ncbi:microtubule-associated protein Jupiter isoform X11 [Stomoxys calcitrans]|uniref:microtubule-associated protein Jupiter isoform X11 n=1 Tax=Stomoxys calcitrans TaxID=35570 RepID=UPI0027E33203|nr:microtubule-associated protein Jupiter isoform X11 [Stomoxys calcitrans]